MLIITRRPGERIMLGDDTTIHIMEIVGNNVRVVANSVVMTDVADNLTVVGVPARIRWRNRAARAAAAAVTSILPGRDMDGAADLLSMLPLL